MSYTSARDMMSKAKFYEAYSRWDDDLNRYEDWSESVHRVMDMHRMHLTPVMTPTLSTLIDETEEVYANQEILGAQRALQYGGKQLLTHMARMYNCAASYCDRPAFFGEAFYLMLCGTGVGFSVQKHHVAKLPSITRRTKQSKEFIIPDSIEGWSMAVDVLLSSFFVGGGKHPEYEGRKILFNFDEVRPEGALISGGFKAPGPEPLRKALQKIEELLKSVIEANESTIRPIVAYDIVMFIADAVISGGVRRSATICIFSKDDLEMLAAKTGDWYTTNKQRGRSNNSMLILRDEITREELHLIKESIKHSGEPGFILADDTEALFNPCVEIGQYAYDDDGESGWQMCNLNEANGIKATTPEAFYRMCKYSAILGTIQASYTNFKFLSAATKRIVERESLIGCSITGWMNNPQILFDDEVLQKGAEIVKYWNEVVAKLIGINQAARTTCVKPSGNASTLLGTASGIHGEHSPLYLRHAQFNVNTEVAKLFMKEFPEMVEPSVWSPLDIVVAFPVVTPSTSIYKSDLLGVKQLEYVKKAQQIWIEHGTNHDLCVKPWLRHNVSNTITVDNWDEVFDYVYDNRAYFCGISFLAASGDKAYPQAPFTEVLTHEQIVAQYGEKALFTSALIEAGLNAFNNDLWTACNTALGYGEQLTDGHEHLLKRDFVRRFNKFATNFTSAEDCANCLKDVYNLHKWWRIQKAIKPIDWSTSLSRKEYVDVNTMGAQACSGGNCDLNF